MEIINAKITDTRMGIEDHGIFTIFLSLDLSGGGGQGFGGYDLRQAKNLKRWIDGVLKAVGVDAWENLTGKYIRVKKEGFNKPILAIGHLLDDKWFEPKA